MDPGRVARTRSEPTPTQAQKCRAVAETARELYTSDMIAVQQAWEAGDIGRMGELLGRHIPTRPGQTDWRGFEWHVFRRLYQKAGNPLIRTLPTE